MTVSEEFWKQADLKALAEHWNYKEKLSYDVQKIIPHIRRYKNVADIACGEAKVVQILDQILSFDAVYLCDINEMVLFKTLIQTPLSFKGEICNLNERVPEEVIQSDIVLWLGGLTYIIDNLRLNEILSSFQNIIIRTTCYDKDLYINKYSEELLSQYEVYYRTKDYIVDCLNKYYNKVKVERLYPNRLESKFGGIQYLFVGENKK